MINQGFKDFILRKRKNAEKYKASADRDEEILSLYEKLEKVRKEVDGKKYVLLTTHETQFLMSLINDYTKNQVKNYQDADFLEKY